MSQIIDINGRYTETGNLLQLEYARKAASKGKTVLGIKFKSGVLLAAEKSSTSRIVDTSSNKVIGTFASSFALAHSGLAHDNNVIFYLINEESKGIRKSMERAPKQEEVLERLRYYFRYFTSGPYARPVGCEFLLSSHADGKFNLVHIDPSGYTSQCKAYAIGSSSRSSKTELEKLDFGSMSLEDAIYQAVRIFHLSVGPLEGSFEIEMLHVSEESGYKQTPVDPAAIKKYSEELSDVSMDIAH
jgi:20S proteasome alpha/beta subunit